MDDAVLMASSRLGSHTRNEQFHAIEIYMWSGAKLTKSNIPIFKIHYCTYRWLLVFGLWEKKHLTYFNSAFKGPQNQVFCQWTSYYEWWGPSWTQSFLPKLEKLWLFHMRFLYLCVFCLCYSHRFGKLEKVLLKIAVFDCLTLNK